MMLCSSVGSWLLCNFTCCFCSDFCLPSQVEELKLQCGIFLSVAGFFSDAIQTAFDVTQKIQEIFRKKHCKTHLYSQLERLAKGQLVAQFSRCFRTIYPLWNWLLLQNH